MENGNIENNDLYNTFYLQCVSLLLEILEYMKKIKYYMRYELLGEIRKP